MWPDSNPLARSLRRRMTIAILLPLAAILVLAAILAYYLASHFTRVVHDRWLSDSVNSLAQAVSRQPGSARLELSEPARRLVAWDAEDRTWLRLDAASGGLITGSRLIPLSGPGVDTIGATRLFDGEIDGERVRVARLDLPAAEYGEALTLAVAETVRKRSRTAREIAIAVVVPESLLAALAVWLILTAVTRTVHPLEDLAARLNAQSHLSLDALPLEGVPIEVLPLIQALNDLLARLKATIASKDELLATAAHDLRTPLAAALLHLERVRSLDAESAAAVTTARTALHRAVRAAQQLLALARAESTAANPPAFGPVDLCGIARQIGAEFAPAALARNQSLSLEVPRERVYASGDPDLISTAVANLIDNAIKYTPAGGEIVVAVLDGTRTGIRIADTGPGIPPEARGTGTESRFVRGDRATRDGVEGAGLGLAIAREVAQLHGGGLELAERLDGRGGTLSTLWIPGTAAG